MDHSGNTGTPIDSEYGFGRAIVKVYVHDEAGHFVTRANVRLSRKDLQRYLDGIHVFEDDHADDPLPFPMP